MLSFAPMVEVGSRMGLVEERKTFSRWNRLAPLDSLSRRVIGAVRGEGLKLRPIPVYLRMPKRTSHRSGITWPRPVRQGGKDRWRKFPPNQEFDDILVAKRGRHLSRSPTFWLIATATSFK